MSKKRTKKVRAAWGDFPQKSWEQWFAEFVMSQLAITFYGQHKKWPKKINLNTLSVTDNPDGSANLVVDLA